MQIAVAHMPESHAERPRRDGGKGRLHIGNRPRQVRHLEADVIHHPFAMFPHGLQHTLAHRPEIRPLCGRAGNHRVMHQLGLEGVGKEALKLRLQHRCTVGADLGILARCRADFHQHRQVGCLVKGRGDMIEIFHRHLIHQPADQFERLEAAAGAGLRHVHQGQGRINIAHLHHRCCLCQWRRHQLQAGGGDDAKRAFRADHQIDQVIAGIVLLQRRQQIHHLAGRRHHFQAHAQGSCAAMADDVQPAGIGAKCAADLRRSLGAEDKWEHQPLRLDSLVQVLDDAAGFGDHIHARPVDPADPVHPLQ